MNDDDFKYDFELLQSLDDQIQQLFRQYNVLLIYLQSNPPKNSSHLWKELEGLKPYPADEY